MSSFVTQVRSAGSQFVRYKKRASQSLISVLPYLEGCLLVALGILMLDSVQLLVGGTAGLGLVFSEMTGMGFGTLFFIINLPFYWLAWQRMGAKFTLNTFLCISLLSLLSELLPSYVTFSSVSPYIVAPLGGLLIGIGCTILFSRQASLGGVNILALWLQKKIGFPTGRTLLLGDLIVVGFAIWVLPLEKVALSLLAFATLASVVGRYHTNK